jgi:UDP-N-acetylglucosamine acyltransferase
MVGGHPARPHSINTEGLRRRQFSAQQIARIKRAYKTVYHSAKLLRDAIEQIEAESEEYPELQLFARFLRSSERSIVR